MSWLSPYRWLLIAAAIAALVLGYYAWADHIGDVREAQVRAEYTKATSAENLKNAGITAKLQKDKDDALLAANKRAQDNKAAADRLSVANRGLRDELTSQRSSLSTASLTSCRQYAKAANSVFGQCTAEVERLAKDADGYSSDSLMLQEAWPR